MEESNRKKDLFYLILLILTMVTMVVGITFTYFSLLAKEKNDSTVIKAGTLAINYIEGQTINTYALLPISEPNLNTKYSVYKKSFAVSSSGTLDQNMDIYLNITKSDFKAGDLHFNFYDASGNKLSTGSIPNVGSVLLSSNVFLKAGDNKTFTILIWLQDDDYTYDYTENDYFVGGFDINARQVELK